MTEVDGIEIPRLEQATEDLQLAGKLPVDVGNPRADKPSEKARGDAVIVRMAGEPKSLNPITENSAVKSYILEYVNDALARQDPETFEYLPHMAERWVGGRFGQARAGLSRQGTPREIGRRRTAGIAGVRIHGPRKRRERRAAGHRSRDDRQKRFAAVERLGRRLSDRKDSRCADDRLSHVER